MQGELDAGVFDNDVSVWLKWLFAIDPYDRLAEAFVIWKLPRASKAHASGTDPQAADTAFRVPLNASATGVGKEMSETAKRVWQVLQEFPYPFSDYYPAGDFPASVCSADFDGDGDNDLVTANYNDGNISILSNLTIGLGIGDGVSLPENILTLKSYPNPFNARVTIEYSLGEYSPVKIDVYDILGGYVALLSEGHQMPGTHRVTWEAAGASSGVYFYRITLGEYSAVGKMLLIK